MCRRPSRITSCCTCAGAIGSSRSSKKAIRTVFWFHPAIWWLIGRIQLSREQVVDQAAIRLTESKERYLDALLAVALNKSTTALVPAPLFLRRNLLKKRVAQILQETTMTTRRLIASLTASSRRTRPRGDRGRPLVPARSAGTGASHRSRRADRFRSSRGASTCCTPHFSEYPRRAIEQQVQGDVLLDLVTDERGEVSDARVLSGPDELRRAALESVLQWHYSPEALRSTSLQATLRFSLPADRLQSRRSARTHVARQDEDDEKANRARRPRAPNTS